MTEPEVLKIEKKEEKKMLKALPEKEKSTLRVILEGIGDILIVLIIIIVVRSFFITPFMVKGHSMDSSLHDGEFIIINKLGYELGDVSRGDVIVFLPPVPNASDYYIKRVIGLPGEKVKIKDKKVYVCNEAHPDCFELKESYLNELNAGYTCNVRTNCPTLNDTQKDTSKELVDPEAEYTVPENSYFVLGDNRTGSLDSRFFREKGGSPYVSRDLIEGRSWIELFYTSSEFQNSSWQEIIKKTFGQMSKTSSEPLINFAKFGFTPEADYQE